MVSVGVLRMGVGWLFLGGRKVVGLLRRLLRRREGDHCYERKGLLVGRRDEGDDERLVDGEKVGDLEGMKCGIHHLEEEKENPGGKGKIVVVLVEQI